MEREYRYKEDGFSYGRNIYDKPDKSFYKMHAHEDFEVLLFIRGNAKYVVEGTIYSLKPYDIMIMRPAETHMIMIDDTQVYERIVINFSRKFIQKHFDSDELLRPFLDRSLGQFNRYCSEDFPSNVWKMCLESLSNIPGDGYQRSTYIAINFLNFISELNIAFINMKKGMHIYEDKELSTIEKRLVEYVNENLFNDISINLISTTFFLSPSQIYRVFKRATGSALWRYVTIKRLLAAKEKIKSGEGLYSVCYSCGFGSYSAFYRAYKKYFKVQPANDK